MKGLNVINKNPQSLIINYFLLFILSMAGGLLLPKIASAQILPACTATGNCGICDFLQGFVNVMRWIVGLSGGTALFLMIWNAFGWIVSGGSAEKIQTAKKGVIHTLIAIIIILGAWQAVNIIIALIMGIAPGQKISLFSNNEKAWYQYCSQGNVCQGRSDGMPCDTNGKEDGQFCYQQKCGNYAVFTECSIAPLNYTEKKVESPCEYWANLCPNQMGNFNPYLGYECVTTWAKDEAAPLGQCVDSYESLGPSYCKQEKDKTIVCCLKKQGQ